MPAQLSSNLQILGGLQSQLQSEEDALNAARQQHVYLQTLAEQYRTMQGSSKGTDGTVPVGLPALEQQLDKLKTQLADLRSRGYTDRHPDVHKTIEQIAETEKMRDDLLAALKTKAPEGAVAGTDSANLDPAQAAMSAPIQSQMRSNQLEITNREHSIATLKAKDGRLSGLD